MVTKKEVYYQQYSQVLNIVDPVTEDWQSS